MAVVPPAWAQSSWIYFGLAFLLAVLALLTLLRSQSSQKSKSGNSILLLGPSDAGKTAILTRLIYGQFIPTHTSLQANETVFTLEGTSKPLLLVDVPGHPRIRAQSGELLSSAKGIVFVVDASTIARNGPSVAEHLHTILHAVTKLPPSTHTPPILIFANKSDLISVPASSTREGVATERVRTILERELEKRRQSSITGVGVGGLGESAEDEDGAIQGGLETLGDGPFTFTKWEGGEVTIQGGCANQQVKEKGDTTSEKSSAAQGGLEGILSWLDGL